MFHVSPKNQIHQKLKNSNPFQRKVKIIQSAIPGLGIPASPVSTKEKNYDYI